jgi:hypothetical protein
MDERQAQVKQGAGLEEGRINQEFVDVLQKWSTPVLLLLTAAAALWWGWQRLEQMRYDTRDQAFSQLADALVGNSVNPVVLEQIASDYGSVPDVVILAKQSAGSAYVASIIRGVTTDVIVNDDGTIDEQWLLDDDAKARYAQRARRLFNDVIEMTAGENARAVVAMNAAYGLAALAETEGNTEDAVSWYNRAAEFAQAGNYELQAALAASRAASAPGLATVQLYNEDQLARLPEPERPAEGVDPLDRLGVTGLPDPDAPADEVVAEPIGPGMDEGTDEPEANTDTEADGPA